MTYPNEKAGGMASNDFPLESDVTSLKMLNVAT
jgi:hypothetical protein